MNENLIKELQKLYKQLTDDATSIGTHYLIGKRDGAKRVIELLKEHYDFSEY